jgi:putative peptide zinc metalloprotease protein
MPTTQERERTVASRTAARADEACGERAGGAPPVLADGVELIGEYKDSGYREPPSIARRADGQVVLLPEILFRLAESADGGRGYEEIAARVGDKTRFRISPDDARFLVEEKLRPLGILAGPDGHSPPLQKVDPLLGLRLRVAVVPRRVVRALTTLFSWTFLPLVVTAALAGVVAFDTWFFFLHGVGQSVRELVYNPLLLLMVLGLIVVATTFHEIGHATAARYGGAEPGVMGVGIYVVWPAFYTDVTDAYRLDRRGRLRTDLGGVYYNALFVLAVAAAYFLTGFEPVLVVALLQHFQVLQQLLPFLRLDGYYVLSDLTGVPDLFARIKPTLRSLVPGRRDPKVQELKTWVRFAVASWVVFLVPTLLAVFGMMAVNVPRIFATTWDSFLVHLEASEAAFDRGRTLEGTFSGLQIVLLSLPALGVALSGGRAGKRALTSAWAWSAGQPLRRTGVVLAAAAMASLLGYVWFPNGDYRPVQPGERGMIQGGIEQLRHLPGGRPGLTSKRAKELGNALFQSDGDRATPEPASPAPSTQKEDATETTQTTGSTEATQTTGPPGTKTAPTGTTEDAPEADTGATTTTTTTTTTEPTYTTTPTQTTAPGETTTAPSGPTDTLPEPSAPTTTNPTTVTTP